MTDIHQTAEQLRSIVQAYSTKFQNISETESMKPLDEGKWSRKMILGHLLDSASNNHQRFVRLQLASNLNLPGYQQEEWVLLQGYQEEPWSDLVALWKSYNNHLAHIMERMSEEALMNSCSINNGEPVTLRFIAEDYVRHLKHHLEQMKLT